ncbi:MAG TPA: hypothetical protein VGK97_00515 [Spongiibacteraceae bacterium]
MKWINFVCLLFISACTQSALSADNVKQTADNAAHGAKPSARGSPSPSAPVDLTYRISDSGATGQPIAIDIAINTRLNAGSLLVEVAKQQGATLLDASAHRIDLAVASRPLTLQLTAIPTAQTERFIVLLLTIDTEMGPMSRSFRIDLSPPVRDANGAQ